jgi:hypothetical protein
MPPEVRFGIRARCPASPDGNPERPDLSCELDTDTDTASALALDPYIGLESPIRPHAFSNKLNQHGIRELFRIALESIGA